MSDPGSIRIGDAERDDAVDQLREHAAAGRLTSEEFSDRMGKALEARTRGELALLFTDLPAVASADAPPPSPSMALAPYLSYQPVRARSFWSQWWWVIVVVVIAFAAMRGSFFPLIFIAVLGFTLIKPKAPQPDPSAPPRYLTAAEQQEIGSALHSGEKIQAIKRYREITGTDLSTARDSIERWERDLHSGS
ncbi:MAG TPA: DUF1707 domain-containing protein [Arachnia sp.]|nr:DUF1707 domain-containing protein [Arachnia sp.]HMT87369.1 DUF1707 domain-containing protein [Arachnia sp.]